MPKVMIHPHPTKDIRCAGCIFWHPAYINNYAVGNQQQQFAQPVPLADLIKQGLNIEGMLTSRMSICFYGPSWISRDENHYCSHYEKPYIKLVGK